MEKSKDSKKTAKRRRLRNKRNPNNYHQRLYKSLLPHLLPHTATHLPTYLPSPMPHPRLRVPFKNSQSILQAQSITTPPPAQPRRVIAEPPPNLHTSAYQMCRTCKAMDGMTIRRGRSFRWMTWLRGHGEVDGAEKTIGRCVGAARQG